MSGLRQGALTIGILLFVGCGGDSTAADERKVPFAGDCYSIPEWNARPINASPFWPGSAKRESEFSITLRFPGPQQGRLISFFAPAKSERAQRDANRKRVHHDIWYALGEYRNRALEPIPGTNLLRVYPLAGGETWMVVTHKPDVQRRDTHLRQDFWIATCQHAGPHRTRICSADVDAGPYILTLSLNEPDLVHRKEIARDAVRMLDTWRTPCSDPAH